MLNPSTRSGGIAVRLKYSFHSRDSARSCSAHLGRSWQAGPRGLSLKRKLFTAPTISPCSDQVDAVTGEAGQKQSRRVDLADVPETGEEQPPVGVRDHRVE